MGVRGEKGVWKAESRRLCLVPPRSRSNRPTHHTTPQPNPSVHLHTYTFELKHTSPLLLLLLLLRAHGRERGRDDEGPAQRGRHQGDREAEEGRGTRHSCVCVSLSCGCGCCVDVWVVGLERAAGLFGGWGKGMSSASKGGRRVSTWCLGCVGVRSFDPTLSIHHRSHSTVPTECVDVKSMLASGRRCGLLSGIGTGTRTAAHARVRGTRGGSGPMDLWGKKGPPSSCFGSSQPPTDSDTTSTERLTHWDGGTGRLIVCLLG